MATIPPSNRESDTASTDTTTLTETITLLQGRLDASERMRALVTRIHEAEDLPAALVEILPEIAQLFHARRLTVYVLDHEKRQLVSRFFPPGALGGELDEIRVPIDGSSIAGFVAKYRLPVHVADAYDADELRRVHPDLRHDASFDRRTGFHTRQVHAVPILARGKMLVGVLQFLNIHPRALLDHDREGRIADLVATLGVALWNRMRRELDEGGSDPARRLERLVQRGVVTSEVFDQALEEARREDRPVEYVLIEKHGVRKKDVGEALSHFYGCPFLDYESRIVVPPGLVKGMSLAYLKTHFWVPLDVDEDTATVLIDDPLSKAKVLDVRRTFPGRAIRFVVGLRGDIFRVIQELGAPAPAPSPGGRVGALVDQFIAEEKETAGETAKPPAGMDEIVDETSSAVIQLANQIIADAVKARASDIHLEPNSGDDDMVVRLRVDGLCREYLRLPARIRQPLASRFKVMATLDIAEHRRPQDGKIKARLDSGEIELRVVTIPTTGLDNEDVVLRVLTSGERLPMDGLGLTERNLRELRSILEKPYGLFLCVGPTGSGKTTTLHAAIAELNRPDTKIWTIEDPVEITQKGIRQVQVNPRLDLTFAAALRSFLRADPDVIMLGEMRDRETAHTAIQASLTGHFVLSTLHTNSAAETVIRLLEMGLDPFSFADSLLGVLGQRLIRRLCDRCREPFAAPAEYVDSLAKAYGREAFETLDVVGRGRITLARASGCSACDGSGYRGRLGIHELMVASPQMKQLVRTKMPVTEIERTAMAEGMTTLVQDGILKILAGETDLAQVFTAAAR